MLSLRTRELNLWPQAKGSYLTSDTVVETDEKTCITPKICLPYTCYTLLMQNSKE